MIDLFSHYQCLDNPEKISLKQGVNYNDNKMLYIEAYYCRDQTYCKSDDQIKAWKNQDAQKVFHFFYNKKTYQPNHYGEEMILNKVELTEYTNIARWLPKPVMQIARQALKQLQLYWKYRNTWM